MAEDAIDTVMQRLAMRPVRCSTTDHQLAGSEGWKPNFWEELVQEYGVPPQAAWLLSQKFGAAAKEVLDLTKDDPGLNDPLAAGSPSVLAQVVYGVRREMATSIEDILARRTGLQLFSWMQAISAAPTVGAVIARELGWSSNQQKDAVEEYVDKINQLIRVAGLRPREIPG
jgi:glycerol-3-phosphate dehydrogenase